MKQSKSPALTSPWKIGLLVSLLIAVTGAGVNLLLMRVFHFSWNWFNLTPGNYAFYPEQFMEQMFPQVALVLGICVLAYFTITAAVRKYRAYLDSGLDYKQLIQSIGQIKDLTDESVAKKLKKYPELKDFLVEMQSTLKERDGVINQQSADLERFAQDAELAMQIRSESMAVAHAIRETIVTGRGGELNLEITSPGLQDVVDAVLEIPVRKESACGDEEKARMLALHEDLLEAREFIISRLDEIARDLAGNSEEAKSIEAQIGALRQVLGAGDAGKEGDEKMRVLTEIVAGVSNVGRLSETLTELGEETRSVAINSALKAGSGEGTMADMIQLADDVKEIARKYDQSASACRTMTDELSMQVSALRKMVDVDTGDAEAALPSAIDTLASKMLLWVERIVILSDKVKNLQETYHVSFQTVEERVKGYAAIEQADDSFDLEKSETLRLQTGSRADLDAGFTPETREDDDIAADMEPSFSEEAIRDAMPSLNLGGSDADGGSEDAAPSGFEGIITERNIFESTQDAEDEYFAGRPMRIKDQFDKIQTPAGGDTPQSGAVDEQTPVPEEVNDRPAAEMTTEEVSDRPAAEMTTEEVSDRPAAEMMTEEVSDRAAAEMTTEEVSDRAAAEMMTEEVSDRAAAEMTTEEVSDRAAAGMMTEEVNDRAAAGMATEEVNDRIADTEMAPFAPGPPVMDDMNDTRADEAAGTAGEEPAQADDDIIDLYALGAVDYVAQHSEQQ